MPPEDRPSRADRKVIATETARIRKRLVETPPERLDELGLPEPLVEAIALYRQIQRHGALRRQGLLIDKLLRLEDLDSLDAALDAGEHRADPHLAELERWRRRIVDDGDRAIQAFVVHYPEVDRHRLRTLARQAAGDGKKARAAFDALFRVLAEATGA